MDVLVNLTMANVSEVVPTVSLQTQSTFQIRHAMTSFVYCVGVIGNISALGFLYGSSTAPRNPSHLLGLKCLAFNDLIAVLGMWVQMNLKLHNPYIASTQWFCAFRVFWRCFGLGSGCIVTVMAVERWIALTRPFFYHKNITFAVIRKAILGLWAINILVVIAPFLGFGLYYKEGKCVRYKEGVDFLDRIYAMLYFLYGFSLCCTLIICNMAVIRKLMAPKEKKKVLMRRISRNQDLCDTSSTEELSFARCMGWLCIVIIICWLPQLITIPVAQLTYPIKNRTFITQFINWGDVIYALHFIIDPYFYILLRWSWFNGLCKRKSNSRSNSSKTHHELVTL